MYAVGHRHVAVAERFIRRGIDLEASNTVGGFPPETPSTILAWSDSFMIARPALAEQYGQTALLIAAANESVDMVECLVQAGANLEARDNVRGPKLGCRNSHCATFALTGIGIGHVTDRRDSAGHRHRQGECCYHEVPCTDGSGCERNQQRGTLACCRLLSCNAGRLTWNPS